jgi:hypothetical protein
VEVEVVVSSIGNASEITGDVDNDDDDDDEELESLFRLSVLVVFTKVIVCK